MLSPASARVLTLAALCFGCEPQVLRLGLDTDGKDAYRKIADAWCSNIERCARDANSGREWASHTACVDSMTLQMPSTFEVACDGSNDIAINAQNLADCLAAFQRASCQRLPVFLGQGLAQLADEATLAGCAAAIDEIRAIEDAAYRIAEPGSACDEHTRCYCERPGGAACGVCRALPKDGEPCIIEGDGAMVCSGPYGCSSRGLCERDAGAEGEPCKDLRCQRGLECMAGRCVQQHREGDACATATDCGASFRCEQGRCRYRPGVQLGEACAWAPPSNDLRCTSGLCVDGVCRERPDLGQPCARECPDCEPYCLRPYICIAGTCAADIPLCSAGPGEPCRGNSDCHAGHYCRDSDFRCAPGPVHLGEQCVPDGGCDTGACVDGRCVWREAGDTCLSDSECASDRCETGRCASPQC
jgi:hypothetical protein